MFHGVGTVLSGFFILNQRTEMDLYILILVDLIFFRQEHLQQLKEAMFGILQLDKEQWPVFIYFDKMQYELTIRGLIENYT
jgi:hypothetical protein